MIGKQTHYRRRGGIIPRRFCYIRRGSNRDESGKTVTGTAAGGSCVLKLPEAGTWSVSATLNGQTSNTQSVSVKDSYAVSLTFFSATITVTVDSGASVALKRTARQSRQRPARGRRYLP